MSEFKEGLKELKEELMDEFVDDYEEKAEKKLRKSSSEKFIIGKIKRVISAVLAGAILLTAGVVGGYFYSKDKHLNPIAPYVDNPSVEVFLNTLDSEIKNIGELATIEYIYTNAGKYDSAKQLFGKDIPFTTKSFVAKWDGTIKAGIDVEQISTVVDYFGKKIYVYLPEAEILSHEIDEESFETLNEKDGLFNPITVENVKDFDSISKEAMEQRAVEIGLLEKATENAKGIIENLVFANPAVKESYTIEFKTA